MKKYLSYIYVILSAVCWGFIGFSNRMLTEVGVSLGNRVFIRNFGTLVILTIVFALFHRQVFRIKLKHLPIFLCSGLLSILTLSLVYFQCQTMCSLSVAAVLLYLAPSFVVIFSAVLWKTPLTKRKLIALVVSLLGCVMVSGIIGGDMTASWAGIGLGVLSGLCYASYTVFAHYGLAHYESYTMIYWTFLVAGLGSVFFADFETLPLAFSGTQGIVGVCGVVIVATVRALKYHGGVPKAELNRENLSALEKGLPNLLHHVETIRRSGVTPVVCLNRFYTDTEAELALVRRVCEAHGVRCAVSDHWRYGGAGAEELARVVLDACEEPSDFRLLYSDELPLRQRVERIAREVYGADGVDWSPLAAEKAARFESGPQYAGYCTMMVKTHLSLSHDPTLKGVPTGWRLPVRDVLEYSGARFLCPVAGGISMMPGTGSDPAYRRVDIDTTTGEVTGLF